MIREGQLVSRNLSQEECTSCPRSKKMEVMIRLPDGFSCLDLAVVFLRRGGVVTNCASVSSLGPAARAREQLFPLRPLTKGQPVCENRSFPEELMMPMEIVAGMDLNPTMAGFQALFIRKQPTFGHCLCFTFASCSPFPANTPCRQHARLRKSPEGTFSKIEVSAALPLSFCLLFIIRERENQERKQKCKPVGCLIYLAV